MGLITYTYVFLFLCASILIALFALPVRSSSSAATWARLLFPITLVVVAGFALGWMVAAGGIHGAAVELAGVLRGWQSGTPAIFVQLMRIPIEWLDTIARDPGLPGMLALTLLFLWVYLLIRLGLYLFFGIFRLLYRFFRWSLRKFRRGKKGIEPESLPIFPYKLPLHTGFLVPSTRLSLVILAILLAALPWSTKIQSLAVYLGMLFWAGSWVALLEIQSWLKVNEQGIHTGTITGADMESSHIEPLAELYREYQRRHSERLLLVRFEPGYATPAEHLDLSEDRSDTLEEAARRRFKTLFPDFLVARLSSVLRQYLQGQDILFTETLSAIHFTLFAEIIELCVRRGDSVLILCPDGAQRSVEWSLANQLDTNHLRLLLSVVLVGVDPLAVDQRVDVVICPEQRLADVVDGPMFETVCGRLALLIGLDVQGMDAASLRFELVRLRMRLTYRTPRLVFHMEPYRHAESSVRELLPFHDLHEDRLNPRSVLPRYLLIWNAAQNGQASLQSWYAKGYAGYMDMAPLLCFLPSERGFPIAYLDPEHRLDSDLLERMTSQINVYHAGAQARSEKWLQLRPTALSYLDSEEVVVVSEDRSNLALAVYKNYRFLSDRTILVNIVAHNYLLRDFLVSRLYGEQEESFYRLSDDSLLPRIPRAQGGLSDLARAVRIAIARSPGLSRTELVSFFDIRAFPLQALLLEKEIDATLEGLRRLFAEIWKDTLGLQSSRSRNDIYFRCRNTSPLEDRRWRITNSQGEVLEYVAAGDYGLQFVENSYLMLNGKFHRVAEVLPDRGIVQVVHQDDEEYKRYRYFFDRTYQLQEVVWLEGDSSDHVRGGLHVRISHQHRHVMRTTYGYLEIAEALRPFDEGEVEYNRLLISQRLSSSIQTQRRWRNVLEIRLSGGPLEGMDEESLARTAFTLSALLWESLFSLFPAQAGHLAVVSPMAARKDRDSLRNDLGPETLPILLYPDMDTTEESTGEGIDLYLVEDAETDLGVVRSIKDDYDQFLEVVLEYLDWAADQEPSRLYHSFGAANLPTCFDYESVRTLLTVLYPGKLAPRIAQTPPISVAETPEVEIEKECDFCAALLPGPRFDLSDGRMQCPKCQTSAITRLEDFRHLLMEVRKKMSGRYCVRLPRAIDVKFETAQEIARSAGEAFTPTEQFDPRTVGLAIRNRETGHTEMLVENGAPRISTIATIAHELTHIWQYQVVGNKDFDEELAEGQARYIEIDFLRANGGERLAERLERHALMDNDIYARGWRYVRQTCNFDPGGVFRCFEEMLENRMSD